MSSSAHRAVRWIPCAVVGALVVCAAPRARGADDARAWLERMHQALTKSNYEGTFFHLSEGRVETMHIVHRMKAGHMTERLQSLDGSGREFVRSNDQLICYLPDQHTVLVEPRQERGPLLGTLPQFGSDANDYYRIELLGAAHVLGRPARLIAVNPKDQFRFGYRLWLDETTAMPLKTQLCDSHGQVIEQILFARLDMRESISDAELQPAVRTAGMHWVHQGPAHDTDASALAAYRASELPPGFHLTAAGAQTLGESAAPAAHLVYSDGLATVSVFVEPANDDKGASSHAANGTAENAAAATAAAEAPMEGLARVGSGFAFSTMVQGHQVTAVGEVPAQTVEFIAHSIRSYDAPRH